MINVQRANCVEKHRTAPRPALIYPHSGVCQSNLNFAFKFAYLRTTFTECFTPNSSMSRGAVWGVLKRHLCLWIVQMIRAVPIAKLQCHQRVWVWGLYLLPRHLHQKFRSFRIKIIIVVNIKYCWTIIENSLETIFLSHRKWWTENQVFMAVYNVRNRGYLNDAFQNENIIVMIKLYCHQKMNCQGNFEEGLRIIFYDNRLVGKPQFTRGRIQFRNTTEPKKERTLDTWHFIRVKHWICDFYK